LLRERRFKNPGEEFFVALSQRFLNRILRIHFHEAVVLIPSVRGVLQRADVI
jgi:hypothetical protein